MMDIYQQLLSRSATDMRFRELLLTEPRKALQEFYGPDADIPEDLDVEFIENDADVTLVLPDLVNEEEQLSENEIETVAGGDDGSWYNTIDEVGEMVHDAAKAVRTVGCDTCYTE